MDCRATAGLGRYVLSTSGPTCAGAVPVRAGETAVAAWARRCWAESRRQGQLLRRPAGLRVSLAGAEVVGGIGMDVLVRGPQRLDRELGAAYRIAAGLGQRVEAAVGEGLEADPAQQMVGDVVIAGGGGHDAGIGVMADGDVRSFRHELHLAGSGTCGWRGSARERDLELPEISAKACGGLREPHV